MVLERLRQVVQISAHELQLAHVHKVVVVCVKPMEERARERVLILLTPLCRILRNLESTERGRNVECRGHF